MYKKRYVNNVEIRLHATATEECSKTQIQQFTPDILMGYKKSNASKWKHKLNSFVFAHCLLGY